jgi:hypothetical protein
VRAAARSAAGGSGDVLAGGLSDALDSAGVATPLGRERRPWWWFVRGALQWLLAAAAIVGVLWLLGLIVAAWLQLPDPPTYHLGPIALPTVLLVGGVVLGLVVALIGRVAGRVGARRRARRAESKLREAIAGVAQARVLDPVVAELAHHREVRDALEAARRR